MLSIIVICSIIIDGLCIKQSKQIYATEHKNYIVMAKNDEIFEDFISQHEDQIVEEKTTDILEKNNIAVIDMNERELKNSIRLFRDEDIIIEEDVVVTAMTKEEKDIEYNDMCELMKMDSQQIPWNVKAIHVTKQDLEMFIDSNPMINSSIKIGIIDSGVEVLGEIKTVERINLIDREGSAVPMYEDLTGHGTSVAGIINARDDDYGLVGVNPKVDLFDIKVFDDVNQAPLSRIIEGIEYAMEKEIKVLNMSFGTNVSSEILHRKIAEAYELGMLLVASSGNEGIVEYPAAYDEVMAVGATTEKNKVANFSLVGTESEIVAPGEAIMTSGLLGGYAVESGTSLAAPHVAAAATLLWEKDPTMSNDFIRQLLNKSARRLDDTNSGNGLLDVAKAFEIYDEFLQAYEPGKIEYKEIPENKDNMISFNENYVVGSWYAQQSGGHNGTIESTGYLTSEVKLLKKAANNADEGNYSATKNKPVNLVLHGGTVDKASFDLPNKTDRTGDNYISNIRYLYQAAQEMYNTGKISVNINQYPNVSSELEYNGVPADGKSKTIINDLLDTVVYPGTDESSKEKKGLKILGYAIHLAGDVYAHRAIISNNTKVISMLDPAHFGGTGNCELSEIESQAFLVTRSTKKCTHLNCLKKGIAEGIIEGKDVAAWMTDHNTIYYEDNSDFMPSRYEGAKWTVKYLMARFSKNLSITASLFKPKDENNNQFIVDINGLKKFYKENNWDTTDLVGVNYLR